MSEVEQIAQKFAVIRKFLESIGMAPTSCTYRRENIESASMEEQRDALLWLFGFEEGYIGAYKKAKGLSNNLTQALYELHGGSAYEQRQVKIARRLIFKEWKNRPPILRKYGSKLQINETRKRLRKTKKGS